MNALLIASAATWADVASQVVLAAMVVAILYVQNR